MRAERPTRVHGAPLGTEAGGEQRGRQCGWRGSQRPLGGALQVLKPEGSLLKVQTLKN